LITLIKPIDATTPTDARIVDDQQVAGQAHTSEVVTLAYQWIEWQVGNTKAGYDYPSRTKF
jgi:type VI protein secretion system component Hcp